MTATTLDEPLLGTGSTATVWSRNIGRPPRSATFSRHCLEPRSSATASSRGQAPADRRCCPATHTHDVVVWGPVSWEIPTDRNVHVSVHLEGDHLTQAASLILPPGEERAVLVYATDYTSGTGSLA